MKLVDVISDQSALSVMPWARADTVPRIYRVWALRTEVSTPGTVAGIHFGRQPLTDRVGSGYAPQVSSFARAIAHNEESHGSGLWALCKVFNPKPIRTTEITPIADTAFLMWFSLCIIPMPVGVIE